MAESKEKLSKIMNRLRARLFNHFEAMGLTEEQLKAHKQAVKDITSSTWNDLDVLLNDERGSK
jgi:hypothetical protein